MASAGLFRRVRAQVGWREQIDALIADGYAGYMVIETHFAPKVAASRASAEALLGMLRDAGEAIE
jgi:sugar phosphate isomerase/epimerase